MNIVVQSSKWFKFLKSAAMIGTGSAVLWAIFWNPKQGIWKAQRQVCLWSFPREILQGELISVTILRRSPTKQEPRALGSCGASMQGHGHPRVQVFSNVECLQPVGPWLHFFQELEHNPYPYSLHRGNQTLGRSSPVGLELSRIEWQIHFVPRNVLQSRDMLPRCPCTLYWVSKGSWYDDKVQDLGVSWISSWAHGLGT